jgi:hypothetical protein
MIADCEFHIGRSFYLISNVRAECSVPDHAACDDYRGGDDAEEFKVISAAAGRFLNSFE